MPAKQVLNRKEIIESIKKYKGKIALVAQSLKVSTGTIYNYSMRFKSVKNAIESAQESWDCTLIDVAESKLFKAVTNGNAWAVRYTLETKGRKRGYVTKNEIKLDTDTFISEIKERKTKLKNLSEEDLIELSRILRKASENDEIIGG